MTTAAPTLLSINAGSASLKMATFRAANDDREPELIERTSIELDGASLAPQEAVQHALEVARAQLPSLSGPIAAIGHRIVHGADRPSPLELSPELIEQLTRLSPLAPLHQPVALALVHATHALWPQVRQFAVFDTSWHHTLPEQHRVLALPRALQAQGVRRYGFHGLAFQSALRELSRIAPELDQARLVLAHLGGGSSLCAVREGVSVNTTMGMTPLSGVPMATRPGSLDPGVMVHLQRTLGWSVDAIERVLWRESGLLGISGVSGDMRTLLASSSPGAQLAVQIYASAVAQAIAAMATCIGGVDALVFSGGIGANARPVRNRILAELAWLGFSPETAPGGALGPSARRSRPASFAVHIDEELEIARAIAGGAGALR